MESFNFSRSFSSISGLTNNLDKLSKPLFEVGGNKFSLISILIAVLIFCLAIYLSKIVEKLVGRSLKDSHLDSGIQGSISKFSRYLILLIGIVIMMDIIGIGLSSLAAVGAIIGVGLGFGLQNITQNFISGLIILLERPIKVGDLVHVKGVTGRVEVIGSRSTTIITRDDLAIIVPNSQFISEQVINESHSGMKMRLHVNIGVGYGSDTSLVKETLLEIAANHQKILSYPEPKVQFRDFGDSSLDFVLLIWVNDNWSGDFITSDLRFAIDNAFRERKIKIPFPQREVYSHSVSS